MEKIAVLELDSNKIKMQLVKIIRNRSFSVYNEITMPFNLTRDFYNDYIIKPNIVKELNNILKSFKSIVDKDGITDTICFATPLLNEAKNINGVINEIANVSTFKFNILNAETEINHTYTAVTNTFNKPKGIIINVSAFSTQILRYNRRNILNLEIIPYGSMNIAPIITEENLSNEMCCDKVKAFISEIVSKYTWLEECTEDFEIIGTGPMFINLGLLSRRAKKYPLNIAHGYELNYEDFKKVYDVVKPLEANATSKLKGIPQEESQYFPISLAIIDGVYSIFNDKKLSISATSKTEGMLFNYVIPLTMEKPITDTLGYSLQAITDYFGTFTERNEKIYEISMILYKQLKVLHKLNRSFVKVLRIASYLANAGERVAYSTKEKSAFHIILNSDIYGVSHSEMLLASFVSLLRDADNFSLSDWVKYKDILKEEDIVAVRKLAIIIKLAEALNVTGYGVVKDISCDILGHSVIMKTIVEGDASLEIKYGMLCGTEFKKAYNKNLEII